MPSVAIIGSFRKHNASVQAAKATLVERGVQVLSPRGTDLDDPDVEFVRYDTDFDHHSDAEVQSLALRQIMAADVVLVIAPSGYVGNTTCYELGRLFQARRVVVFTEAPLDLPVQVSAQQVMTVEQLTSRILDGAAIPPWCALLNGLCAEVEQGLVEWDR